MTTIVRNLLLLGFASFALAAYAGVQIAGAGPRFQGTTYPDAPPAPGFTLVDHRGATTSLADFEGRAILLFFGFSRCPDVCPLTLARLSRLLAEARLDANRIGVLFVTVDPEYDTPETLADYVVRFGDVVTGLRPDPDEISDLLHRYGAFVQPGRGRDGAETLAHTDLLFGIDRGGRLRVLIHADGPEDVLLGDIRSLLRTRP